MKAAGQDLRIIRILFFQELQRRSAPPWKSSPGQRLPSSTAGLRGRLTLIAVLKWGFRKFAAKPDRIGPVSESPFHVRNPGEASVLRPQSAARALLTREHEALHNRVKDDSILLVRPVGRPQIERIFCTVAERLNAVFDKPPFCLRS